MPAKKTTPKEIYNAWRDYFPNMGNGVKTPSGFNSEATRALK